MVENASRETPNEVDASRQAACCSSWRRRPQRQVSLDPFPAADFDSGDVHGFNSEWKAFVEEMSGKFRRWCLGRFSGTGAMDGTLWDASRGVDTQYKVSLEKDQRHSNVNQLISPVNLLLLERCQTASMKYKSNAKHAPRST